MELHVLSIAVHLSVGGFPVLIYDKFLEAMGVNFVLTGYVCDYAKLIGARFGEPVSGTVECSALVFDGEKHSYAAYGEKDGLCKTPVWLERPYVIGSGQDHAMTAMEMGATAAESGEMAQKRDISTGGVVRTLFVADRATAR